MYVIKKVSLSTLPSHQSLKHPAKDGIFLNLLLRVLKQYLKSQPISSP